MPNELFYQRKLCTTIRNAGGYARKWASQYSVGVPDLITVLPVFGPLLIEVKLIKPIASTFNRQIGLTPRQRHELTLLEEAGARTMVLVVIVGAKRSVRVTGLHHSATHVSDATASLPMPTPATVLDDLATLYRDTVSHIGD